MRKFMVGTGIAAAAIAVLLVAAAGLFFWEMTRTFNPAPPVANYPKPITALEAQRQDVDYFARLVVLDRSFSPSARDEAGRRIGALEASVQVLPQPTLRVELMKILALADNGHTHLSADDTLEPKTLPLGVYDFSDGLYILWARKDDADLLGSRVLAIDHIPIDTVMARLREIRGGTEQERELLASNYITLQDILYGDGIATDPDHSTWTVASPEGRMTDRVVAAFRPKPTVPDFWSHRWLSPEPARTLSDWRAYPPAAAPLTLRDADETFRRLRIPSSCAMLVQLKANTDVGKEHISDFLKATEADMADHPPCAVILDLRFNGGGDYTNTYSFANRLPRLVTAGGHIFILTGPETFSAAITTTAFVKQAGGNRVTILGEPVGDRLSFYSEGGMGCLPHAHLCVYYQTGKHDYARPCTDWDRCYWLNWLYPVRVKSLAPDETIALSFADWRAGRDPVFDRALALAGNGARS